MGNIPEFMTRQLASSVVGTLGVDTSGQRVGEAIANVGARVGNIGLTEMAKRKEILNTTEAETKQREFDLSLSEEINRIQKDFSDNPDEAMKEIEERSNIMSEEFLSKISNARVKELASIRIEQAKTRKSKELQSWTFNQEVINFGKNLESSVNTLGEVVSNTTSLDVFKTVMEDAEKLIESGYGGLSTKNATNFENGTKQFIAEQFINNLLEEDPIQARELLDLDVFTDLLPPSKKEFLEVQAAQNAFMVEADTDVALAVKNVESNNNLTPIEKVNATNRWFNKKAAWDKNLDKIVKEKQQKATTSIFNGINDGSITDISVLRGLTKGFGLSYNTQKSLEQDFENKISGKTVDDAVSYNHYFDELLDGVQYSSEDLRTLKDVSPENRLKLLGIRDQLTKDPIFKNELYIQSKAIINDLFKVGLLDKIDPNFQNKKATAKWDYIQAIVSRRAAEGMSPENENRIVSEEFAILREKIDKTRGVGITVRSSSADVISRKKELLQKVINQSASQEEKEELRNLNEGR